MGLLKRQGSSPSSRTIAERRHLPIVSLYDCGITIPIPCGYSIFVTKLEHRSAEIIRQYSERDFLMNEKHCMCTAVFCGHASREICPNQESVRVRLSVGTEMSGFGPQLEIGMCEPCWANLQRNLPGLFYSRFALEKGQLKGMNELRESFWFDARAMHLRELPKRLAS